MITDESGKVSSFSGVAEESLHELKVNSSIRDAYANGDQSSDRVLSSISPLENDSALNLKISERRDATLDMSSRRNSKEN